MRSKKRAGKTPKKRGKAPTLARRAFQYVIHWPWRIIVILGVLSSLSSYLYLLPKLDVNPGPGFERASDPMRVALSLTNNGYFALTFKNVRCYINSWVNEEGGSVEKIAFQYASPIETLRSGETAEFAREDLLGRAPPGAKVLSADFLAIIQYNQQMCPWLLEKRVRFQAMRDTNGEWVWHRPFLTELDRKREPESTFVFEPKAP